ncbi:MAG TPA: hypothetical protein VMO26_00245 [Vicinamibacterales bacterium]|nr:hypothetical protein [Vicinamibacterales bacterium]
MVTPSGLIELARNPALIKGIYNVCDHWCMYCPATSRCLAYRCSPGVTHLREHGPGENSDEGDDDHLLESLMTIKCLAEAEGRRAPADIETFLSGDSQSLQRMFRIDDPLERQGRQYMVTSTTYLATRAASSPHASSSTAGPTALEVFSWFHVLVPARIFRALLSASEAHHGVARRGEDALGAAKLALVGIDRSIDALTTLAAEDDDPRVELLVAQLRRLGPDVERRFPAARAYLRPGLDAG